MTPIERLLDELRAERLQREWYAHSEWQKKALAEIHAMAVRNHRAIGQLCRHATRRLQQGATK